MPGGTVAVIPARMESQRFPGKPLADLDGLPLVVRVARQVGGAAGLDRVIIATDSAAILQAARSHGCQVVMTSARPRCGSERVWEAVRRRSCEWVLNVQGDEPLVTPALIEALLAARDRDPGVPVWTVAGPLAHQRDWRNPDVVKVVADRRGRALYFSRAPIPWHRDGLPAPADLGWRHYGLYLFRRDVLREYVAWPPGRWEQAEKLEQLRLLERGIPLGLVTTRETLIGVDRPADLRRVRQYSRMKAWTWT